MTTIDEIGRRAAEAARADAAAMAATQAESGLDRLHVGSAPVVHVLRANRDPRRWVMLGTAVAVAAAAIIALVVNANEGESHRVIPGATSTEATTASTSVVTTGAPDTTELTNVTAPAVTTAVTSPGDAIAAIYLTPPPAYPATPIASVAAPADPTQMPLVAISENWIVTVDTATSAATLIDRFAPGDPPKQIPLAAGLAGTSIAAGPGDVLYGVVQGSGTDMSLDAIALSGDRAGKVVASAPMSAVEFAETPNGLLGHGSDGIIDRRTGKVLLGYVDVMGQPTSIGRAVHTVGTILGDVGSNDLVVRDPDGKHGWHLAIQRDPKSPGFFNGEAPPAPSSHGGAVVSTALGPPASSSDIASPTEPVVAVLAADGTGQWYSLADGWQLAASDIDGTVLMRRTGNTVELARLDPPQRIDFLNQPAAPHQRVEYAVTLPTALTSAPPCTVDDLAMVPTADGAMGTVYGNLSVRNKSDHPCHVKGVPQIDLVNDQGNVVQSTASANVNGNADAAAIVLEKDSWAVAQLGPVASNVCGGNQSSQLRLTIDTKSAVVPFTVGGLLQPNGCDASQNTIDGTLGVQPFAPIPDNTGVPNPLDQLDVTIDAPATIRAGDVLHFDVVMAARDSEQVLLGGTCPIYSETLGAATGQFLLNCTGRDGVLIGAGESVRFHVELPIPAGAAPGATTLTWTPIEPTGTAITATVTITP